MSARRQLEELCSPNSPSYSLISPTVPHTKQRTTSLSSGISSSSNPRTVLNNVKSNFRRTSSLGAPRKPSIRPLFITPILQRQTIQRGLSDEGPISSKFLKPEEYDEMPVKSVCINDFATSHTPKVIKRDINSNPNRRNLRLNLNKITDRTKNSLPISKTDSLAVFLKYENEAKQVERPVDLTEKELKDKTNILSKQTYQKNFMNNISQVSDKENIPSLKDPLANIIENKNNFTDNSKNPDQTSKPLISSKVYPIRLEPLHKPKLPTNMLSSNTPSGINLSSILEFKGNDYIDPKLINVCDNLPVNICKLSDSDLTSSSTDSASTTKVVTETPNQFQRQSQYVQYQQTSSNRNSAEKRNLLKRQLRLGKNQFLYDMSPDSDPYSDECDKTISMIESSTKVLDRSLNEPSFDDIDFEEFLSSFEHDEDQFPIFKDCKEFLLNQSFNKRCSNLNEYSNRSPTSINPEYEKDGGNGEIFISVETSQNDSSPSPTKPSLSYPNDKNVDKNENKEQRISDEQISFHEEKQDIFEDITKNNARNINRKVEYELDQNDPNLEHTCDSGSTMYPVDSDEINSVDCYPIRKNARCKQSADSAYGSFSRHSPTDQWPLRKNLSRNRQQNAIPIPEQQLHLKSKYLHKNERKQKNRNLSASSSGSDNSLPPIQPLKNEEKLYQESEPQCKNDVRMSKFCHECGSKFLISHAKFCMECGIRRIVLD